MTDRSELWNVRAQVVGNIDGISHNDTHEVLVRINPPFGIRSADAEVIALRALQETFPSCDAQAISSRFIEYVNK